MRKAGRAGGRGYRRSTVTASVVGLFVLIISASAAMIVVVEARSSDAQGRHRMQAVAAIAQAFVAEQAAGLKQLVAAYGERLTAAGALESSAARRNGYVEATAGLDRLREADPDVSIAFLTDADGVLICVRPDIPALVGSRFAFRDWYRGAVRTGRPYMSEVYHSVTDTQRFVVAASMVVRGRSVNGRPGPVLGVLAATYALSSFQHFVDGYAADTGIDLVIVDQRGVLVAAAGDRRGTADSLPARRDAGRRVLKAEGVLSAFVTDPVTGWRIGSGVPSAVSKASAARFRWMVVTTAGLIMLMVGGAAFAEARLSRGRRRSKEDVELFFGVSLDLLCIAGTDGYFKRINPAWRAVLGYDDEELLGRPFLAFVHPADVDATLAEMDSLAAGAMTVRFENRYRCKNGTYRWLMWQTVPVPERRLLYAVARDITGRRETEQASAQLAAIVDSSVDAIIAADLTGAITSWNHGAERMFGYSSEQIIGQPTRLLSPADHRDQDDRLARAARGEEVAPYEATWVRQDGRPIEVALSKSPVRSPDGSVVGVAMIARDVSRAKRDADALGAIIESASDAFISIDTDGNVTEWNHRAETLFGWQRDEVLGHDLAELVIPERAKGAHRAGITHAFTGGGAGILDRARDITAVGRDGVEFPAEITVWPVSTGSGNQFSAFVRDVSQRQQFERDLAAARDDALEASRLKSEFLATMSHEIRTPMNGLIGLTGLLIRGELNDTARHYAERIRIAGRVLLSVINDILDFSKIEAGALILDDTPVNLNELVGEVLELVAESAHGKGLELVGHCAASLPEVVRGDPVRIRQILLNFAVNAVKFTEHGEVFIRICPCPGDAVLPGAPDGGIDIRLEVIDTGIGIPHEYRKRLFDAFAQADSSTTRRFGGTGLGLAICRELVQAMGGQIGVDSKPGSGSIFWCDLRLRPELVTTSSVFDNMNTLAGLRLLVVDDNATSRRVLADQTRAWGMDVVAVASGEEALDILRDACSEQLPFDVLITDLHMPESTGLDLAEKIRHHRTIRPLPIVLMSMEAPRASADLTDTGITATITKPVQQSHLYACLIRATMGASTPATVPPESPGPDSRDGNDERLLLAEDNETNQIVAVGVLTELGYLVDVASDGYQALELLSRNTYRAVIMDCQMPNLDGYDAASEIRRREAATAARAEPAAGALPHRIPIIAMTAATLQEDRDRCYAAGMDDYLSKPFEPEDLAVAVRRWVEEAGPPPGLDDREITTRLSRLRDNLPPASIDRLIASFLRDGRQCVSTLRAASDRADAVAIARTAHTFNGASSSIGAVSLAALCRSLEQRAAAGDLRGSAERVARIEQQYEHTSELLQAITPSRVAPTEEMRNPR